MSSDFEPSPTPEPPIGPTPEPPGGPHYVPPDVPPPASSAPTWSPAGAIALVATFVLLNALAGSIALFIRDSSLSVPLKSVAAFGVILLSQLVVIGMVWGSAQRGAVSFRAAVHFNAPAMPHWLVAAVSYAVLARLFATAFAALVQSLGLELPGQDVDPTRLLPDGPIGIALTILLVVLAAPFAEEIVFRGVLVPSLASRYSTWLAVLAAAGLFALVHFNAFSTIPVFVAGLAFGHLFVRSDSVWPSIVSHSVFNALGVVALLAFRQMGLG